MILATGPWELFTHRYAIAGKLGAMPGIPLCMWLQLRFPPMRPISLHRFGDRLISSCQMDRFGTWNAGSFKKDFNILVKFLHRNLLHPKAFYGDRGDVQGAFQALLMGMI